METKQNTDRLKLLALLSPEENNLVLYDALHDKDLTKFFYLLKQGYALTPFILNCMIDSGYEKHIEKALLACQRCRPDIYQFFCVYWGVEATEDFFVKHQFNTLMKDSFPVASLVKYQLWEILGARKEFYVLAVNKQFDLLKKLSKQRKNLDKICEVLCKVEAADTLVEIGESIKLREFPAGHLKLFELKNWSWVCLETVSQLKQVPIEELLKQICAAGGEKYIYFSKYNNFLLNNGYYKYFVKDKCWSALAQVGAFEVIDWEDYYTRSEGDEQFCNFAAKAGKWDFLASHHERWFLLLKKQFRWWWKSFK